MDNLEITKNPEIETVFNRYPDHIREKLLQLRSLIIETASGIDGISTIEETLKWGEPSYLVKHGSTIRIDWKEMKPEQYAIYFKCTSKLVPTFKTVFGNIFTYETDRAIVFGLNEVIPKTELRRCIIAALQYHKVKHLPNLGI
jgi:Domain of unknown function (DU1801).